MKIAEENNKKIRKNILKVATNLFIKKGYKKTSIKEIAEKLNISRTPIYYHFKSKENLSKLCVDMLFQKYNRSIDEIIYSDTSIECKFREISDFIYKNNNELYKIHVDLANNAPTDAYRVYLDHLNAQFDKIKSIIVLEHNSKNHNNKEAIRVDDLMNLLFTLYNGLIFMPNNCKNKFNNEVYSDSIIKSILTLI